MDIQYFPGYKPEENTTLSLLISEELLDSRHAEGQIEESNQRIENLAGALARLIETLTERGLLTLDEVVQIIRIYGEITKV